MSDPSSPISTLEMIAVSLTAISAFVAVRADRRAGRAEARAEDAGQSVEVSLGAQREANRIAEEAKAAAEKTNDLTSATFALAEQQRKDSIAPSLCFVVEQVHSTPQVCLKNAGPGAATDIKIDARVAQGVNDSRQDDTQNVANHIMGMFSGQASLMAGISSEPLAARQKFDRLGVEIICSDSDGDTHIWRGSPFGLEKFK